MTKRCLDEGTLQAYADGELSAEAARGAAAHIAACAACAEALASAEQESAFFAAAFAPDEHLSVPTEMLRARVNAAVARLENSDAARERRTGRWNLKAFVASLSGAFAFTPQRAAAFASLLALVALAGIYFTVQKPSRPTNVQVARNETPSRAEGGDATAGAAAVQESVKPSDVNGSTNVTPDEAAVVKVTARSARKTKAPRAKSPDAPSALPNVAETAEVLLPGEREYERAIAALKRSVEMGGDAALSPSARADYERSLAVIDNAIAETRRVAARNPKDRDAVGFLMTAYQNKVDLLTTVADQAQVAALGR
jgi:anti-sigma factor RsiW